MTPQDPKDPVPATPNPLDGTPRSGLMQAIREGRGVFVTVLVLALLVLLGIALYVMNAWPTQFLYMLF